MPIPVACACGQKFAAQDRLAGKTVKCPKCGQPITIPGPAGGAPPGQPAAPKPASAKPAAPTPPTQKPAVPQKPAAQQPVDLFAKTPAQPAAQKPVDLFGSLSAPDTGVGGILDEIGLEQSKTATRCPNCGGDMAADAKICVKCGFNTQTGKRLQTVSDTQAQQRRDAAYAKQAARSGGRGRQKSSSSYSESNDADLTALEILFCVLCAGLGFIVGVIYMVTGNPKGGKMAGISLCMIVFWNVLRFGLIAMNAGAPQ